MTVEISHTKSEIIPILLAKKSLFVGGGCRWRPIRAAIGHGLGAGPVVSDWSADPTGEGQEGGPGVKGGWVNCNENQVDFDGSAVP